MSSTASSKISSPDFLSEIKCMMYSCGDVKQPNPQSVALIEGITHNQMTDLVVRTAEVTRLRGGGKFVSAEDIFFLLRKKNDRLKTILRHLKLKALTRNTQSPDAEEPSISQRVLDDPGPFDSPQPPKKRKYSLSFLSHNDQAVVYSPEQDIHTVQRHQRMDELTKNMEPAEYANYSRCRQVNFNKNTTKFSEWLNLSALTEFKFSQEVVEILGYLSYEIVREIVELSLQVKADIEQTTTSLRAPVSYTLRPHSPSGFGATPTFFTTPTSPTGILPECSPTSTSILAGVGSGAVATSERLSTNSRAISPEHIHEAMRRFNYTLGPMVSLSTHTAKPSLHKHLCT